MPNHLFATGEVYSDVQEIAFYKSTDGGSTWSWHSVATNGCGYHLALDPNNDSTIYLGGKCEGTKNVLFKTTDGGASWVKISSPVISGTINQIVVDPVFTGRIYLATSTGLFQSENSGTSWKKVLDIGTESIAVNPNAPNEVYAGGYFGVYKSLNGGQSWLEWNNGLAVKSVKTLDLIPQSRMIFAGTLGGSVFKNRQGGLYLLDINASPGGTTTPAPNIYAYLYGKSVQVRARPSPHHRFVGWSGDASGMANPMTLVMNADKSVTANFLRNIYAPLSFAGVKKENRALLKVEYINVLSWQANPNNESSIGYRLYLVEDGSRHLVDELAGNAAQYLHRNVERDRSYTYALAAYDTTGREGEAATVTVR